MAFLFITENFYLLVVLYEALKPITDFRSFLPMIKITLEEKKAHFKGITNKLTKKAFSYQAKFGDKAIDFKNR